MVEPAPLHDLTFASYLTFYASVSLYSGELGSAHIVFSKKQSWLLKFVGIFESVVKYSH